MTAITALAPPLPSDGSPDGVSLLALERATQERPLSLPGLLREAMDDARGVVLVARDQQDARGPVVGMASARILGDEAHVVRLAVDPGQRRRGIGRALLDGLIGWAAEAGAPAVVLEVRPQNAAALALYAAAGFGVDGRRPGYYPDGEAALLMRRIVVGTDPGPDAGRA